MDGHNGEPQVESPPPPAASSKKAAEENGLNGHHLNGNSTHEANGENGVALAAAQEDVIKAVDNVEAKLLNLARCADESGSKESLQDDDAKSEDDPLNNRDEEKGGEEVSQGEMGGRDEVKDADDAAVENVETTPPESDQTISDETTDEVTKTEKTIEDELPTQVEESQASKDESIEAASAENEIVEGNVLNEASPEEAISALTVTANKEEVGNEDGVDSVTVDEEKAILEPPFVSMVAHMVYPLGLFIDASSDSAPSIKNEADPVETDDMNEPNTIAKEAESAEKEANDVVESIITSEPLPSVSMEAQQTSNEAKPSEEAADDALQPEPPLVSMVAHQVVNSCDESSVVTSNETEEVAISNVTPENEAPRESSSDVEQKMESSEPLAVISDEMSCDLSAECREVESSSPGNHEVEMEKKDVAEDKLENEAAETIPLEEHQEKVESDALIQEPSPLAGESTDDNVITEDVEDACKEEVAEPVSVTEHATIDEAPKEEPVSNEQEAVQPVPLTEDPIDDKLAEAAEGVSNEEAAEPISVTEPGIIDKDPLTSEQQPIEPISLTEEPFDDKLPEAVEDLPKEEPVPMTEPAVIDEAPKIEPVEPSSNLNEEQKSLEPIDVSPAEEIVGNASIDPQVSEATEVKECPHVEVTQSAELIQVEKLSQDAKVEAESLETELKDEEGKKCENEFISAETKSEEEKVEEKLVIESEPVIEEKKAVDTKITQPEEVIQAGEEASKELKEKNEMNSAVDEASIKSSLTGKEGNSLAEKVVEPFSGSTHQEEKPCEGSTQALVLTNEGKPSEDFQSPSAATLESQEETKSTGDNLIELHLGKSTEPVELPLASSEAEKKESVAVIEAENKSEEKEKKKEVVGTSTSEIAEEKLESNVPEETKQKTANDTALPGGQQKESSADEPPKPPARTKGSKVDAPSATSVMDSKVNDQSSPGSVEETTPEPARTPISHQESVRPPQPTGLMAYIRSFFSCVSAKK